MEQRPTPQESPEAEQLEVDQAVVEDKGREAVKAWLTAKNSGSAFRAIETAGETAVADIGKLDPDQFRNLAQSLGAAELYQRSNESTRGISSFDLPVNQQLLGPLLNYPTLRANYHLPHLSNHWRLRVRRHEPNGQLDIQMYNRVLDEKKKYYRKTIEKLQ